MVVDSSALIAILFEEPEAEAFTRAIEADDYAVASVATILETTIAAVRKKGDRMVKDVDLLIAALSLDVVAMDRAQLDAARRAFLRYGKGRHAAGLNFGDCISYALARTTGEALLCKGADFSKTDIQLAGG